MPKDGDTIFNVSVRLGTETMNKLDFIAAVEGVPRGRFVREALEDYLSGLSLDAHPALQCYVDYCSAMRKAPVLSRTAFIANWVNRSQQKGQR